jgi:hypothetical protein
VTGYPGIAQTPLIPYTPQKSPSAPSFPLAIAENALNANTLTKDHIHSKPNFSLVTPGGGE